MVKQGLQAANVLWTGGWDSTFRVIQLVKSGQPVNPHYIIYHDRDSTNTEIKTIKKLTDIINRRFGKLIDEIRITDSKTLRIDPSTREAYQKIFETSYLGSQYVELATYCRQAGINDLELCIHKDDRAYDHVCRFIEYADDGRGFLSDTAPAHIRSIFSNFYFPILDITKLEMEKHARQWQAEDIMETTWFCHKPFIGKPCGTCYPCMYTIDEGLSRRFPNIALIRYRLKLELRKFPALSKVVQSLVPRRYQ